MIVLYENLTEEREEILSTLNGVCPRCGGDADFQRRGSHSHPYLRCIKCGLDIQFYSKSNRLLDLAIGLGFLAVLIFMFAMLAGFVAGINAPPKEQLETFLSMVA